MGRILLKGIGGLLLVLVLTFSLFLVLMQLPSGRKIWAQCTETVLSQVLQERVSISAIEGNFPLSFVIEGIEIGDKENPWMKADHLTVGWQVAALLSGQMKVSQLHAEELIVSLSGVQRWWEERAPQTSSLWLWKIACEEIACDHLVIDASKDQEPFEGRLEGKWIYYPFQKKQSFKMRGSAFDAFAHLSLQLDKEELSLSGQCHGTQEIFNRLKIAWECAAWEVDFDTEGSLDALADWQNHSDQILLQGHVHGKVSLIKDEEVLAPRWQKVPWEVETDFIWRPGGNLSLQAVALKSPLLQGTGEAAFSQSFEHIQGEGEVILEELGQIDYFDGLPISGSVTLQGSFSGSIDHPDSHVQYSFGALTIDEMAFDKVEGEWSAAYHEDHFEGVTSLGVVISNLSLASQASFVWDMERFCLSQVSIRQGEKEVVGDLCIDQAKHYSGNLTGSIGPLQPWGRLLGYSLGGSLDLNICFSHQDEKQWGEAHFTFHELTVGQGRAALVEVTMSSDDLFSKEGIQVEVQGESLAVYDHHIEEAHLTGIFRPYATSTFSLMSKSQLPVAIEVAASGELLWLEKRGIEGKLISLSGAIDHQAFALVESCQFQIGQELFILEDFSARAGGGAIGMHVHYGSQARALDVQLHHFPTSWLFFPFVEHSVGGTTSLQMALKDVGQGIEGKISGHFEGAEYRTQTFPKHIEIQALLGQGLLHVQTHLIEDGMHTFHVQADVPFLMSAIGWQAVFDRQKPFSLSLQGDISIEQLLMASFLSEGHAKGELEADLHFSGTLENLVAQGQLQWLNGDYQSYSMGSHFSNIHMQLVGSGDALVLDALNFHVIGGGQVTGNGKIDLNFQEKFPLEGLLQVDQAMLIDVDMAKAAISGNLQMIGNLQEVAIRGDIFVGEGRLNIPSKLPPSIPDLHPIFINVPVKAITAPDLPSWEFPVILDVGVHIDGDFLVQGRGISSTWRGSLRALGDSRYPDIKGVLKMHTGTYAFSGAVFSFTKGEITFDGKVPKGISILAEAEMPRSEVTIIASLSGPLTGPRIRFRSSPPRTQEEILAMILFNRDVDDISPLEAFKLGQVLFELSGDSPGPDLMGGVQSTFGLDRLGVSNSADGGISLQAGKYILNGVLFSLQKDVYADGASFNLETSLKRGFYLQGQYNQFAESKVFLKWRHSY